jgi:hypothetical protein
MDRNCAFFADSAGICSQSLLDIPVNGLKGIVHPIGMPQGYRTASVQFLKGLDLFKNTSFGLPQTDGTVPLITWDIRDAGTQPLGDGFFFLPTSCGLYSTTLYPCHNLIWAL